MIVFVVQLKMFVFFSDGVVNMFARTVLMTLLILRTLNMLRSLLTLTCVPSVMIIYT